MYPVLFQLGPLTVYSFGAMMAIAFLLAGYITGKEMKRKGLPAEPASTMLVWAAIGGIVGSRLWIIFKDWDEFVSNPLQMVFTGAGFVWYGGLVGGTLAVSYVIKREGLPWLQVADCTAPTLALAHGIGRIGCQLAGDGDWGTVSDLPWAMAYPNAIIGWDYPPGVRVHPTPIYEMLAYFLVFGILWSMRKRPQSDGTLFWWYLVLAPFFRLLVEFVRINPRLWLGLSEAQWFSLLLMAIGAWRLIASARNTAVPLRPANR